MADKVKLNSAPLIKNLVYNDSKAKGFYFFILADSAKVEKAVWKNNNVNPNNVRMAKE